ncbi:MAG: nitroreductase family protein [Rhodospirillaceae bacterium]|nr:nitroreductase family protein [Rhodospirillaceae bacterium]
MRADTPSELDLASVDTVLSTARSVRRRLDFDRPVEQATILDCIDIATQAPTGLGGESWRFVVVLDAFRKRRLAELYRTVLLELAEERGLVIKPTQQALVARLHEIPAMILVCTTAPPPQGEVAAQVAYYGSILPAAWSLMLALRARQLGATWTTLLSSRQKAVGKILEMPEDAVLTVMLPVAYTKNARLNRAERVPARQVTFWDAWGKEI